VSRADADLVADRLGGNPLTLKLAATVLDQDGIDAIRDVLNDPAVALEVRARLIQGQLYKRILGHVHDDDVKKLAYPGLVVRRTDRAVRGEGLAEPCGLSVPDLATANKLFGKLNDEVSLVRLDADGALYHRTDVRRVMLDLLRQEAPDQVRAIHERAV